MITHHFPVNRKKINVVYTCYVIDQSISTIKILQNNEEVIEIEGIKITPSHMCLWVILERKKTIEKISDIRSLIFLMKLIEWKRVVLNVGYTPVLKIGYKVEVKRNKGKKGN